MHYIETVLLENKSHRIFSDTGARGLIQEIMQPVLHRAAIIVYSPWWFSLPDFTFCCYQNFLMK